MSICDSEENRKKLAWLVPGYILLAWFFCVLFQPMGVHHHPKARKGSTLLHHQYLAHPTDKHYEVVYLEHDEQNPGTCMGNGSVITLDRGSRSAVMLRFGHFQYRPFNCSLRLVVDQRELDGLTAVIEEMDLRKKPEDFALASSDSDSHGSDSGPLGNLAWGMSECIDYVEVYTDQAKVRNRLCGKWNLRGCSRSRKLSSHGPNTTLIGYCYDDRSGHSCETRELNLDVVVDARGRRVLTDYGIELHRSKGFTIVVTGYRHPKAEDNFMCNPVNEFTCPNMDHSIHDAKPHCIWDALRCDYHQNCGFTLNADEQGCPGADPGGGREAGQQQQQSWWSVSTMTLLVVTYLAIILVLVLVTMLFLRWHRAFAPAAAELAAGGAPHPGPTAAELFEAQELARGEHHQHRFPGGAARRGVGVAGGVAGGGARGAEGISIMVMYKPRPASGQQPATGEAPPAYESIFSRAQQESGSSPAEPAPADTSDETTALSVPASAGDPAGPNYSVVTLSLPPEEARTVMESVAAAMASHDQQHMPQSVTGEGQESSNPSEETHTWRSATPEDSGAVDGASALPAPQERDGGEERASERAEQQDQRPPDVRCGQQDC